jgi:hypothetical protein
LDVIRRELKKVTPDVKIDSEQIADVLRNEVVRREILEGDKAIEAAKKISRIASKALKNKEKLLVKNVDIKNIYNN